MVSSSGATLMPCCARTLRSYLMFWPILRIDGILEQRLQQRQALRRRESARCRRASPKSKRLRAGAVAERHVAGFARRHGHGEADELGDHGIDRRRLGVEGEAAGGVGLRDPGFEALARRDGLVLGAVEWRFRCGCGLGGTRRRRFRHDAARSSPSRRPARRASLVGTIGADRKLRRAPAARRPAPRRCAASAC